MADKKIDEATHDDAIGGDEKLPMDDAGTAKYATTGDVKNYVLAQIAALAAAQGVNLDADGVYLLKDGSIKPINAQTLAGAVLDYGLSLAGIVSINGNEIIGIKDGSSAKKTMTVTQLANYLASNVAIPWASLPTVTQQADLAANDLLVFRDVSAGTGGADKKFTFTTFSAYVNAAFKAYVASLTGIQSGDAVAGTDVVYLIHGGEARQATVAQLLAAAGITNAVSGPNATTENKLPQWDSSTRTLKDGKAVVDTLDASANIPTAAAVKTYVDNHAVDGVVKTSSDQSVAGVKTFTQSPVVPNPTADGHAANKGYADSTFVKKSGAETVYGVKTFNDSPVVPTPTTSYQAATKKYVDDYILSGTVDLTHDQTIAGIKTFAQAPFVAAPTENLHPATKQYVDEKHALDVTLADAQTIAGAKTFSGATTFTGAVTVPTVATTSDNTTNAASTAFVQSAIAASRYAMVYKSFSSGVASLDDVSINLIELPVVATESTETYTVNIPTAIAGKSRHFGMILKVANGSGSVSLSIVGSQTSIFYAEASDTFVIEKNKNYIVMFRELEDNLFLVTKRTLDVSGSVFSEAQA